VALLSRRYLATSQALWFRLKLVEHFGGLIAPKRVHGLFISTCLSISSSYYGKIFQISKVHHFLRVAREFLRSITVNCGCATRPFVCGATGYAPRARWSKVPARSSSRRRVKPSITLFCVSRKRAMTSWNRIMTCGRALGGRGRNGCP